jgi:hypothetical protein
MSINQFGLRKPAEKFFFTEVSADFVCALLKSLKVDKATGLDQLPTRLIMDAADIVTKPLFVIINTSLNQGIVPTMWKNAKVIPLFKGAW